MNRFDKISFGLSLAVWASILLIVIGAAAGITIVICDVAGITIVICDAAGITKVLP